MPKNPLKNVFVKTTPKKEKSYTFRISNQLHARLHHIKSITKSRPDIDINNSLEQHLFETVIALEKMLGISKDDWATGLSTTCPECGKKLIERSGKTGGSFYGCSGFPDCKFTKPKI